MANLYWTATSGPPGQQVSLINPGLPPINQRAILLDPADIVYPAPGGGLLRVPVGGGGPVAINGSGDGQIWYYDASAGQWVVNAAAPTDLQIPVWNAGANRYDFTAQISPGNLTYFDASLSPVGLWNFNGTLADSSGNGFDLTASVAIGYAPIFPGKTGVILSSTGSLSRPAHDPLLAITGDIACACIVQLDDNPGGAQSMFSFSSTGETQATNTLYQGSVGAFSGPPRRMVWLSESGAGVDSSFTSGGSSSLGLIHNVMFLGWNRSGNVMQMYMNGKPFGPPSAALTTPDGGTSSRLFVGGVTSISSVLFTAQIVARSLSAAEWLAMYNRSMGPAFGILT